MMEEKLNKKSHRKQKRAYHRLLKDMDIKCCDNPTQVSIHFCNLFITILGIFFHFTVLQYIMICNAGLVTGLQRKTLQDVIDPFVDLYDLIMPLNKSYCFIKFYSVEVATYVHNKINGNIKINGQNTPLYATFTESGI